MSEAFEEDRYPTYLQASDIFDAHLDQARSILRSGGSLVEAAGEIGWRSTDLDKALWARLGMTR